MTPRPAAIAFRGHFLFANNHYNPDCLSAVDTPDRGTPASDPSATGTALVSTFTLRGQVAMAVGIEDDDWIRFVLRERSGLRLHVLTTTRDAARLQRILGVSPEESRIVIAPVLDAEGGVELGAYLKREELRRVHYLRIGPGVDLERLLRDAPRTFERGQVDFLDACPHASSGAAGARELLRSWRYELFDATIGFLAPLSAAGAPSGDGGDLFAVNERFAVKFFGKGVEPELAAVCVAHGIRPKGIVVAGAHEDPDAARLVGLGIRKAVFIEANPELHAVLAGHVSGERDLSAWTFSCAASDSDEGTVAFHLASMNQASSILPMKDHAAIYGDIVETGLVTVPVRTIDSLVAEVCAGTPGNAVEDFNILTLDIQGAELLALRGAARLLETVDLVFLEINYAELYAGGALIDEIDDFLEEKGFRRVATSCYWHTTWGDAFYVRGRIGARGAQVREGLR